MLLTQRKNVPVKSLSVLKTLINFFHPYNKKNPPKIPPHFPPQDFFWPIFGVEKKPLVIYVFIVYPLITIS